MAAHGFFQYLKLKFFATIIRTLNYLGVRHTLKPSGACANDFIRIPSRDLNRFIKAWIYYPNNYDQSKPYGVVINWHGGGYMMNNHGMDHPFCERVALESNMLVLDVDYRKAPENIFPAAVEDADDVLRWVKGQPRKFDLDRVALSGFSSGGHLSLVAASELRREYEDLDIRAVYSFYPGTDFTIPAEAKKVSEPIAPLPVFFMELIRQCYLPREEDRKLPKASPMFAPANSYPLRVMLFPCSGDVLAPEAEALGKKLNEGGIDASVYTVPNAAHGFDKPIKPQYYNKKETDITYSMVIDDLKSVMQ